MLLITLLCWTSCCSCPQQSQQQWPVQEQTVSCPVGQSQLGCPNWFVAKQNSKMNTICIKSKVHSQTLKNLLSGKGWNGTNYLVYYVFKFNTNPWLIQDYGTWSNITCQFVMPYYETKTIVETKAKYRKAWIFHTCPLISKALKFMSLKTRSIYNTVFYLS